MPKKETYMTVPLDSILDSFTKNLVVKGHEIIHVEHFVDILKGDVVLKVTSVAEPKLVEVEKLDTEWKCHECKCNLAESTEGVKKLEPLEGVPDEAIPQWEFCSDNCMENWKEDASNQKWASMILSK